MFFSDISASSSCFNIELIDIMELLKSHQDYTGGDYPFFEDIEGVRDWYGIVRQTVSRWRKKPDFPHIDPYLYCTKSIDAWLELHNKFERDGSIKGGNL